MHKRLIIAALLFCVTHVAHAADRIVSLKPNITEILFAIGAGDRVVGVTTWCDYPAAARKLPKVADYVQPNVEMILAQHPDLILTSTENSLRAPIEQLTRLGLRVEILSFTTVAQLLQSIEKIGALVDASAAAGQMATRLRGTIAQLHTARTNHPPRALLLVAQNPMIAAGPSSLLGELLEIAGGTNVVTARAPTYPHLSAERVMALRPDVVLQVDDENAPTPPNVTTIPTALLRPGPRLPEGLQLLHHDLASRSGNAQP